MKGPAHKRERTAFVHRAIHLPDIRLTFNQDTADYDRFRPTYTESLFADEHYEIHEALSGVYSRYS